MKRAFFMGLSLLAASAFGLDNPPSGDLIRNEVQVYGNTSAGPGLRFYRGRGHFAFKSPLLAGDVLLGLFGRGFDGSNFSDSDRAAIELRTKENWSSTANGTSIVFRGTPAGSTTMGDVMSISGEGFVSSTSTLTGSFGAVPSEGYNDHRTYNASANGAGYLWGGLWIDGDYDDITGSYSSTDTAHGGPFFVRGRDHTHNNHFSFAGEFNQLCTSTNSTANCTSGIVHTKWDSLGLTASQVGNNIPTIAGITSRIDLTSDSFGTTAVATGTVVDFYAAQGALGGFPGRRFLMLNDFDADKQILTVGNIIKASTTSAVAVSGGGTFSPIDNHALGGFNFVSSTGTITMGSSTFPTPTNTYGSYALFSWFGLCNGNTNAGRDISIPSGGTVLNIGSATVTLKQGNASPGACAVWVGTNAGVWLQVF